MNIFGSMLVVQKLLLLFFNRIPLELSYLNSSYNYRSTWFLGFKAQRINVPILHEYLPVLNICAKINLIL